MCSLILLSEKLDLRMVGTASANLVSGRQKDSQGFY